MVRPGSSRFSLTKPNRLQIIRPAAYILLGIILWVCTLKSGIHATLAGVITAFTIPLHTSGNSSGSLLKDLEHRLHPWIAFLVLPIFAFANAGVSFTGIGHSSFVEPVKLGISLGLFAENQLGVFIMLVLCIKFGLSAMPRDTNRKQLCCISLFCGVGFTMSLFIGSLAFEHSAFDAPIRLSVLTGSILSAVFGYLLIRFASTR